MINRKNFAGFNLDDVFNNEEERLRKEKEQAEKDRRIKELEDRKNKLKEKHGKKKPEAEQKPAPAIGTSSETSIVAYNYIMFEHPAYREPGQTSKTLLHFDASLARLQKAGYERHARPQEAFGLLIDGLEGKLTGQQKDVSDDMLNSYGEWLSMAIERKGDILIAYLDPKNLSWDEKNKKYAVQGSQVDCTSKETFDITGKPSASYIDLKEFEDKFINYTYGQSFSQLPEAMREGNRKAQVFLPPEGRVWPVGRDGFSSRFGVSGYDWASRGVRRAKKISTGNKGDA